MIRSILLCSALVASSAVGALALSVMHDSTYKVQTSRLNAPEISGAFVVPAFAPVRSQPVLKVALKVAMSPSAAAETVALVAPEVLFLTPISSTDTSDDTYVAPKTSTLAPATVKRPTKRLALPKAAIHALPAPTEAAPMIVYQVSPTPVAAPTQRRAAIIPAYYIGVYR